MSYIDRLDQIAAEDCAQLRAKDKEYGGSWLKRGGVGAFMMLARKWDRLETAMGTPLPDLDRFDVIERAVYDEREEGLLDDIGDLRRYLLLVEAEIRERLVLAPDVKPHGVKCGSPDEACSCDNPSIR